MKIARNFLKSKLPLGTLCCVISFLGISLSSFSQNIPDTNFANAIRSACPTCIDASNNLLPPAASLTSLDVSNKNISDLTGLGGFTSLQYFYCSYNQLTSLPALPVNLNWLICNTNQLASLPSLPNNLVLLSCLGNQLTYLPDLPNNLVRLICDSNKLTALPTFPNTLAELHCENNLITTLPNLTSLYRLFCSNNQLSNLPILPNQLLILRCSNNKLTFLPPLPINLFELYCDYNKIISLPSLQNISNLYRLYCQSNQLASLPILPARLEQLFCYNNQLTCLPTLPKSLYNLRIDADKIKCLPNNVAGLQVSDSNSMPIPTPPLCPSTLTHASGTLAAGTYVATQGIISQTSLSVGITNYHASQAITLNPGFQIAEGRTFSAEIRGCK